MDKVRVGIIGTGGMGLSHGKCLSGGEIQGAELTALCDANAESLAAAVKKFGPDLQAFESVDEMFAAGCIDAVLIATPHYHHPVLGIKAFESSLHVLSEKPAGVYTAQVAELNAAAAKSGKMFSMMFQQRTIGLHKKLKDLLEGGELGELKRNSWIITSWYRPQSYYDAGGWRASWAGEGGGVLLNQCPHQLDMWQWFCGMPKRLRAFCSFGKYHNIEVEDDVTAYVEYENGATGTFITSTGEAPGTNRFEVAGDRGKIIMEDGKLTFLRTRTSERQFNAEFTGGFGEPEVWTCDIPAEDTGGKHSEVTAAWIKAILADDPSLMIVDGTEGINSLTLSNAMLLSAWTDGWVDLPLDAEKYHKLLQERIDNSTYVKDTSKTKIMDVEGTF
ncbi:MAG: Gfo/Idh/MocA family oxidoreductase [Phycisphaerae bacterium]|nr:Gfo/Idh/MocA family oxidoreductase [Phycisphaerae bacterium]